ncbi:unnamed protein product [Ambrosiozyma monospora]|uniref:Unnamed protein product n=1 Tax=Ambrosiozyma monospora TaxID=43982 RepID=A0ACB5TUV0_AMBMO|nr:unnamed protein product [Ambrosiozyma monospora]
MKNFENKLKIYAEHVDGLTILKLAQKSGKPPLTVIFQNKEDSNSYNLLNTVQAEHVVLKFSLKDYSPRNEKIKFLDLTIHTTLLAKIPSSTLMLFQSRGSS